MITTVKFEVPMTIDDLVQLRDKVDHLIQMLGGANSSQSSTKSLNIVQCNESGDGNAVKFIDALWGRLGGENKKLVFGMASKFPEGKRFTLNDLSKVLSVPLPTLKAYNRALGRSLNKILSLYCKDDSPGPFGKEWDGENYCQTYCLPKDIRDAILQKPNRGV